MKWNEVTVNWISAICFIHSVVTNLWNCISDWTALSTKLSAFLDKFSEYDWKSISERIRNVIFESYFVLFGLVWFGFMQEKGWMGTNSIVSGVADRNKNLITTGRSFSSVEESFEKIASLIEV